MADDLSGDLVLVLKIEYVDDVIKVYMRGLIFDGVAPTDGSLHIRLASTLYSDIQNFFISI